MDRSTVEGASFGVTVTVANTDDTTTTEQIRVDGFSLDNTSATITLNSTETDEWYRWTERPVRSDRLDSRRQCVGDYPEFRHDLSAVGSC